MKASLHPDELALLNQLRDSSPSDFHYRISLLNQAGWSYATIAEALDVPRSTAYFWASKNTQPRHHSLDSVHAPPRTLRTPRINSSTKFPVKALSPDVPPTDARRITELAPLARRVRGGTSPDSEYARARDELDALVSRHYSRGVPISRLASLADVTYRAMSIRLQEAPHR